MSETGKCPLCLGEKVEGRTTVTVDYGDGVVVIRNVPAKVCDQCGSEWIEDKVGERLEDIVRETRKRRPLVEVADYTHEVLETKAG
jgi:YgiT-type zinc finger domain-containing protein